jgi:hypothetical protein
MRETVLLIPDETDRKALIRAPHRDVVFSSCRSIESLHHFLKPSVEALVCGAGMGLLEQRNLVERIDDCAITLVFRLPLTEVAVAELVALARRLPNVRVSLRVSSAEADFASELLTLVGEPDCGPIGLVLGRIADLLPGQAHRLLVAALILGRSRVGVKTYAATCGVSLRSVQASLQRLGLPCPHRMLLWGQAFWMAWRMNRHGLTSKQAAIIGGFGSASTMAASLRPVIIDAPARLANSGGVAGLAERFENELRAYRALMGETSGLWGTSPFYAPAKEA